MFSLVFLSHYDVDLMVKETNMIGFFLKYHVILNHAIEVSK